MDTPRRHGAHTNDPTTISEPSNRAGQPSTGDTPPGRGEGGATTQYCPVHAEYLRRRQISEALAAANGWRCEPSAHTGCKLAIPYGAPEGYIRYRHAKPLPGAGKFTAPAGQPVPLYIPPTLRIDGLEALVVAEGTSGALSLLGANHATIGLGGTGTTLENGRLGPSWAPIIAAKPELIVICFDSCRMVNPAVARDEARLANALEAAGFRVLVAELPYDDTHPKQGPDDFLAREGDAALNAVLEAAGPASPLHRVLAAQEADPKRPREALLDLLDHLPFVAAVREAPLREADEIQRHFATHRAGGGLTKALKNFDRSLAKKARRELEKAEEVPFFVRDRQTYARGPKDQDVLLANFSARIIEEVVEVESESRSLKIVAHHENGTELTFSTTMEKLAADAWWTKLGLGFVVYPAPLAPQRMRAAIQLLSHDVTRTFVVRSHGWVRHDGRWSYVWNGGVIGPAPFRVELPRTAPPTRLDPGGDLDRGFTALATLFRVADRASTGPLIAAALRASFVSVVPVPFILALIAATGSCKSTLLILLQRLYGITKESLFGWSATAAAIEDHVSSYKDALVDLDDFSPSSSHPSDPQRILFARVATAVGNGAGRPRMSSTMERQAERPPRGLVVSTGEDRTGTAAAVARTFEVPLRNLDKDRLTAAQKSGGDLAVVTARFLAWMAPRLDELKRFVVDWVEEHRDELNSELRGHARAGDRAAHLLVTVELMKAFIRDEAPSRAEELAEMLEGMRIGILEAGGRQADAERQRDEVSVWLRELSDLVENQSVRLAPARGGAAAANDPTLVGYFDREYVYVLQDRAHAAVLKSRSARNEGFSISLEMIKERLAGRGYLKQVAEKGRKTEKLTTIPGSPRVVPIRRDKFEVNIPHVDDDLPSAHGRRSL